MKAAAFEELLTSIREAGEIRRGLRRPSRVAEFQRVEVKQLRANAAQVIDLVVSTGLPAILMQHGLSAAVLLDVDAYESLMGEFAMLRDLRTAERQVAAGEGASQAKAAKKLRSRLGK